LFKVWLKPVLAGVLPAAVWFAVGHVDANWYSIAMAIASGLAPYCAVVAAVEWSPALLRNVARRVALPSVSRSS